MTIIAPFKRLHSILKNHRAKRRRKKMMAERGNDSPTSSGDLENDSQSNVIRPCGTTESECGYCKGARCSLVNKPPSASSKSYSVLADSMTPAVYEGFLYRGWRRSGIHLYKPDSFGSCCPTLTIRLKTKDFQMTKSQAKIMKRMNKLLTAPPPDMQQSQLKKSDRDVKNSSKSSATSMEATVSASGILTVLEETTMTALHKCLALQPTKSSTEVNEGSSSQPSQVWKSQYRLLKPSKRDVKQSQVQAMSLVCAQASGRLANISREELVGNVVEEIIEAMKTNRTLDNCTGVKVVAIEAHKLSGQIRCTLQVAQPQKVEMVQMPVSSSIDDNDVIMTDTEDHDDEETDDKLGRWYRKTTGRQLDPSQRQITVETMAAHESALNPDVHRLYSHYQHIVHGDVDPFVVVSSSDADGIDDDPHGNDGKSSNDNNVSDTLSNDDEDAVPSLNQAELDWGNAPTYFTGRIQTMLTEYLDTVTETCRNAVLSNYYNFFQFLVEAPFPCKEPTTAGNDQQNPLRRSSSMDPTKDCGLYHQHYRLGELLIAVGVVDILPRGLSSVYLFYHPSFSHELVALGKYAILKEVEFTRDTLQLPYYYLGYYIESCQKMRYKAEYKPSELLCPEYNVWVDADVGIPKLKKSPRHVCPLAESADQGLNGSDSTGRRQRQNTNVDKNQALRQTQMDIGAGMKVTLEMLQPSGVNIVKPILEDFIEEAGPELSVQCLLKLG